MARKIGNRVWNGHTFKRVWVEFGYIATQLREGFPKVKQSIDAVNEGLLLHRHEFAQECRPKLLDWNWRVDLNLLWAGSLRSLDISAGHSYHGLRALF